MAQVSAFLVVTALVIALLHPGVSTTRIDPNDGGVWVQDVSLKHPINMDEEEASISDLPQPVVTVTSQGGSACPVG